MFIDEEFSLAFFAKVFHLYWNDYIIPLLFAVALIYIFSQKRQFWIKTLGQPFLFLLLTLYNPFIVYWVLKVLDFKERYYRFYWLTLTTFIIAVCVSDLIGDIKNKYYMWLAVVAAVLLLSTVGNRIEYALSIGNVYGINQNVIEVSDIIHSDYKERHDEAKADITVFNDTSLVTLLRQYDASLRPLTSRWDTIGVPGLPLSDAEFPVWASTGRSYLIIANSNVDYEPELVYQDLHNAGAEYFIRQKGWYSDSYVEALGLEYIGESENYIVYRVM